MTARAIVARALAPLALALALPSCQMATSSPRGPDGGGPDAPRAGAPAEAPPREEVPAPPEAPLVVPHVPAAVPRRLASGARVAVVEHRGVPRAALRLVVAAGTAADGEHAGAAVVAAHAVAATLADRAGKLGSPLHVAVGPDAAIFGLEVHPADVDAAIAVLADVVRAPRPGPAEVQRVRAQLSGESRRAAAEDDAHAAAFVIVRDLFDLPTARHPYGTTSPTAEEIAEITPADVRGIVASRYVPAAAALVVAGDVAASDADAAAERALGRGPARPLPGLGLTEPFARERDRVTLVDRGAADGAHVFVGLAAGDGDDETGVLATELALHVAAARLGRGVTARVLRFGEGPQIGVLAIRSSVPRSAVEVRRVLEELDRLAEKAPTEREVAVAQRAILGEAARALSTADGVADLVADAIARDAPEDGIASRLRGIADATGPVVSIAARTLAEAPAHVVVVGSADRLGPELAELAEVKIVDPLAGYARVRSLPQVPR